MDGWNTIRLPFGARPNFQWQAVSFVEANIIPLSCRSLPNTLWLGGKCQPKHFLRQRPLEAPFPFIPTIPDGKLLPPLVPNVSLSLVEVGIFQGHQMLPNRFTKNFSIPKTELYWIIYWTCFSAILGISFPLDRPYPYSLNRFSDSSILATWTKCYGDRYWQDRMPNTKSWLPPFV